MQHVGVGLSQHQWPDLWYEHYEVERDLSNAQCNQEKQQQGSSDADVVSGLVSRALYWINVTRRIDIVG